MNLQIKFFVYPFPVYAAIKEIKDYNPKILNNYLNIINLYLTDPDNYMFRNDHNPTRIEADVTNKHTGVYLIKLSAHFLFDASPEGHSFWYRETTEIKNKIEINEITN